MTPYMADTAVRGRRATSDFTGPAGWSGVGMSDLAMERDLLRDALIGMVRQHCAPTPHTTDQYTHAFTGCEEDAFYALVECGAADWVDNNDYAITFRRQDDV